MAYPSVAATTKNISTGLSVTVDRPGGSDGTGAAYYAAISWMSDANGLSCSIDDAGWYQFIGSSAFLSAGGYYLYTRHARKVGDSSEPSTWTFTLSGGTASTTAIAVFIYRVENEDSYGDSNYSTNNSWPTWTQQTVQPIALATAGVIDSSLTDCQTADVPTGFTTDEQYVNVSGASLYLFQVSGYLSGVLSLSPGSDSTNTLTGVNRKLTEIKSTELISTNGCRVQFIGI